MNAEKVSLFQLPAEIIEYRNLARKIVREELLPLEQTYLQQPNKSQSLRSPDALRNIYPPEVVQHLIKISKDTGLWGMHIPKEWGGFGMSLLAKVVIMEEFNYTAVPFPCADVPNILYECTGAQIDKYLKPCMEGEQISAFAQSEPDAG